MLGCFWDDQVTSYYGFILGDTHSQMDAVLKATSPTTLSQEQNQRKVTNQ